MNNKQKRKRNKALKKPQLVNPDDLGPKLAEGLTQGIPKKEALEAFKPMGTPGVELVKHLAQPDPQSTGSRVPTPRFVASEDADSVWYDEPTGRLQKNVNISYPPDVIAAMRSGEICLRCQEPQDFAFPPVCTSPPEMGCSYPIKDRQIMDFAMEFEGEKHLGPAKPINTYLEEQELRREKKKFIKQKLEGGAGKIPKEWLRDATLFPDGVPETLN